MKTYIIFTPEITNMGGAQMYTANKVLFLKRKGWKVQVFFSKSKGEILIPELKEYKNNHIPEIGFSLCFMPRMMKKRVFQQIAEKCDRTEEIVVESQILSTSFFVEEIAKFLGARHIINTLDERIPVSYKNQNKFFKYKLFRWEFQNAGKRRLLLTFGKDYKDEFLAFENKMVYKCANVVAEEDKQYTFAQSDFTILSIGRLDKPYIMPMTENIKNFACKYCDKTINVIYVGGSFSGEYEVRIEKLLSSIPNINLYLLGYMFPVSKSILDMADVAIACANSVDVTANRDIPTVVVDTHDSFAIGVYGYDTQNKFARTSEPKVAINTYLEAILIDEKYKKRGIESFQIDNINDAFERELLFIEKSKGNIGYYDILNDFSSLEIFFVRLKYLIIKIIGLQKAEKLSLLLKRKKAE